MKVGILNSLKYLKIGNFADKTNDFDGIVHEMRLVDGVIAQYSMFNHHCGSPDSPRYKCFFEFGNIFNVVADSEDEMEPILNQLMTSKMNQILYINGIN